MTDTPHSLWHADNTDPINPISLFVNTTGGTLGIFLWDYSLALNIASNVAVPAVGAVQLKIGNAVVDTLRAVIGVTGHVSVARMMNGRGTEYQLLNGGTIALQPSGVNSDFVAYSGAVAIDYIAV